MVLAAHVWHISEQQPGIESCIQGPYLTAVLKKGCAHGSVLCPGTELRNAGVQAELRAWMCGNGTQAQRLHARTVADLDGLKSFIEEHG